jgi:2,3-bisphosphoglycerate-independent phosphoglycerate mutase
MDGLQQRGEDFRLLLTPDHPTPLSIRTHTDEPVPFVLYDSRKDLFPHGQRYTEAEAEAGGVFLPEGPQLIKLLLEKE